MIIITEPTVIPADKLFKVAKNQMQERMGTKVEVVKTELRIVNGKEMIRGVVKLNVSEIDFVFDSYYYSDDRGSIQVTSWTSEGVWNRNPNFNQNVLNGIIIE